ncbi:hypothetical protein MMC07_008064 [Pseudocyphellaria aurata]|nr:hypothetical protein [Pseudocyphellaria aurata]
MSQTYGVQFPAEAPAIIDPLGLSTTRTPLGGPMDRLSAAALAHDPVTWHRRYWLDIYTVGILLGEDPWLMLLRVEIELNKITDDAIKRALLNDWAPYMRAHVDVKIGLWRVKTLQNDEGLQLRRDLDWMLEDKMRKALDHLRGIEDRMIGFLRDGDGERAPASFDKLLFLYQKLKEEREAAGNEADEDDDEHEEFEREDSVS